MPRSLVLLADTAPVGMVTLCEGDLRERPELNPWLADLFVDQRHRGHGHALRLIEALEADARADGIARLWLFTTDATGLYLKAGWTESETVELDRKAARIMHREL